MNRVRKIVEQHASRIEEITGMSFDEFVNKPDWDKTKLCMALDNQELAKEVFELYHELHQLYHAAEIIENIIEKRLPDEIQTPEEDEAMAQIEDAYDRYKENGDE